MKEIQKLCKNEAEQNVEKPPCLSDGTSSILFSPAYLRQISLRYACIGTAHAAFQCHGIVGQVPLHPRIKAECRKLQWEVGVQEYGVSAAFAEDFMCPCSSRQHVMNSQIPVGKLSVSQNAAAETFLLSALLQLMPQT